MKETKIIYYSDELNDEFSTAKIKPRKIDENYIYSHKNLIWRASSFLLQNVISMPIKWIYAKVKFKHKIIGKEKFKIAKNSGYFIYCNHTQEFADTFLPSLAVFPKRNFFIVNPENVSMKGIQKLVELLGAIPIPSNLKAYKNFFEIIEKRIQSKYSITIYPEAHIWPYYTKIRPFKDVSFKYPSYLNVPVFCITNTYQNYKNNKIQIISYVDGPFYPDPELNIKQNQKMLRDTVYEKMSQRSLNSNIEYIKYIKNNNINR